jgi:hypothetical protein
LNEFLDKNHVTLKNVFLLDLLVSIVQSLQEGFNRKDKRCFAKIHELEKEATYKYSYIELKRGGPQSIVSFHAANALKHFYLSSSPLIGLCIQEEKQG